MTQAGFFALLGTMSFIPGGNIPTSQRRSMIGLCRNAARDGIWQKGNTMIHHLDHLVLTTTNEQACVDRSEEHTSELQSLMRISYAVFCLKKNKILIEQQYTTQYHLINKL